MPRLRGIPAGVVEPALYAVLAHTRDHDDDEASYRVVDDTRACDRLDAVGAPGFARALLVYGADPAMPASISDGALFDEGAVRSWAAISRSCHPTIFSAAMRSRIDAERAWGRDAMEASRSMAGDPARIAADVETLRLSTEPTSDRADSGAVAARLAGLGRRERELWAGLLRHVVARLGA